MPLFVLLWVLSLAAAAAGLHAGSAPACVIAGQRWVGVPELNLNAEQWLDGHVGDTYNWSVNLCQPPVTCGGRPPQSGWIQQRGTKLHASWDTVVSATQSNTSTTIIVSGHGGGWDTTAVVTVECDPSARQPLTDDNNNRVTVMTVSPNNFKFEFRFRSACACGHGCGGDTTAAPGLHAGSAPVCVIAGQRWAGVPDLKFNAVQWLDERPGDTYDWSVNLCRPALMNGGRATQSTALIQMRANDTDFPHWASILRATRSDTETILVLGGKGARYDATAVVRIACDPWAHQQLTDANGGKVAVTTDSPGKYKFSFQFRSACACGHGCDVSPSCKLGPTAWTAVPETRFSDELVLAGTPQGQYVFAFAPCGPPTLCKGQGLVQMANAAGECVASWGKVTGSGSTGDGLQLSVAGGSDAWKATAVVTIACDPAAGPRLVGNDKGAVTVANAGLGNYTFDFRFRSGCACGKGCTSASCFVGGAAWYNVPELAFTAALVVDGAHQPEQRWGFHPCGGGSLCSPPGETAGFLQHEYPSGVACVDWGQPTAFRTVANTSVTLTFTSRTFSGGPCRSQHSAARRQLDPKAAFRPTAATPPTTVVVTVICDTQVGPVLLDANSGQISVTTVAPGQRVTQLKFRSGCACGNGCPPA